MLKQKPIWLGLGGMADSRPFTESPLRSGHNQPRNQPLLGRDSGGRLLMKHEPKTVLFAGRWKLLRAETIPKGQWCEQKDDKKSTPCFPSLSTSNQSWAFTKESSQSSAIANGTIPKNNTSGNPFAILHKHVWGREWNFKKYDCSVWRVAFHS